MTLDEQSEPTLTNRKLVEAIVKIRYISYIPARSFFRLKSKEREEAAEVESVWNVHGFLRVLLKKIRKSPAELPCQTFIVSTWDHD